MQIIIHRGTHQIGGISTEIQTNHSRIIIDIGEELGLDEGFISTPLEIPVVTDHSGFCNAIFLTYNHADHVGQIKYARDDIPLYMGGLTKEIYLTIMLKDMPDLKSRILQANTFIPGRKIHRSEMYLLHHF